MLSHITRLKQKLKQRPLYGWWVVFMLPLALILSGCPTPPPPPPPPPTDAQATGIYILNEGLLQMNNSTLSYYDFESNTFTEDIFLERNHRGLGDIGSDLQAYGSKLYCVVNNSNRVEIMNLSDATVIQSISLNGRQPRKLAFSQGKVYVSCYDGYVARIDTASLIVDGLVHSGPNPEGLCICNNKLYVANSGGLNYPNYGNTVSVIDLSTFSLSKTITVTENPLVLQSYNNQYVYLVSRGNYVDVPYTLQKIDAQTDNIIKTYDIEVLGMTVHNHYAFMYNYDFSSAASWVKVMDLNSDEIIGESFITDGTIIQTPYSITINPLNDDVYITDAGNYTVNGDVHCFDKEGKKKFSITAGLNPCAIVFKR